VHATVQIFRGVAFIRLTGEFTFKAIREFSAEYKDPLSAPDVSELVVDFAHVVYLDSAALGALLLLQDKARKANKRVFLSNCAGRVKEVLELANFHKVFSFRDEMVAT
jgi:anti-anti-sigma factor